MYHLSEKKESEGYSKNVSHQYKILYNSNIVYDINVFLVLRKCVTGVPMINFNNTRIWSTLSEMHIFDFMNSSYSTETLFTQVIKKQDIYYDDVPSA